MEQSMHHAVIRNIVLSLCLAPYFADKHFMQKNDTNFFIKSVKLSQDTSLTSKYAKYLDRITSVDRFLNKKSKYISYHLKSDIIVTVWNQTLHIVLSLRLVYPNLVAK